MVKQLNKNDQVHKLMATHSRTKLVVKSKNKTKTDSEHEGSGLDTQPKIQVLPDLRQKTTATLHKKYDDWNGPEFIDELEQAVAERIVRFAIDNEIHSSYDSRLEHAYKQQLKTIILNLNPNSRLKNTQLLPKIRSGEVTAKQLANMDESDMNPSKWRSSQIKQQEATQISHGEQKATTSLIICGRCGSKTSYTEKQTRSSDEAMTVKVTCPGCGNTFSV